MEGDALHINLGSMILVCKSLKEVRFHKTTFILTQFQLHYSYVIYIYDISLTILQKPQNI